MFAVVVATGWSQALQEVGEKRASCMLPLLDRPFLQHVVEKIAGLSITRMEVIVSHQPQEVEGFLGDGSRWGVSLRYHLARDHHKPYATLPAILLNHEASVLFAHADRLPMVNAGGLSALQKEPEEMIFTTGGGDSFNGWASLKSERLSRVPEDWQEQDLARMLTNDIQKHEPVGVFLSCQDYAGLSRAHWQVLNSHGEGLLLTGKEIEPGIWLSRNVSLHPTARLLPPVWIGENCRVEQGVKLGPEAAVMEGSLLDKRSSLLDSLVFPFSYVGQELEVGQSIVDRNRLVNFNLGASTQVGDAFILGSMERGGLKRIFSTLFDRLLSLLLLLVGSPFLALTALIKVIVGGKSALFTSTEAVKLPLSGGHQQWSTFQLFSFTDGSRRGLDDILLRFLPGLLNVIKGDLSLVGLAPLSPEQLANVSPERVELYGKAKAGLVEEASVVFGPEGGRDDLFVAEAFYTAKSGIAHDLGLLWRYLLACITGRHGRPSE